MRACVMVVVMAWVAAPAWAASAAVVKRSEGDKVQRLQERTQERARQHRLRKVLQISEALGLDDTQTLRLNETLSRYDARHRVLLLERIEARRTLAAAARKNPEALKRVEEAIRRLHDARAASLQLEREVFEAVARDLPPEKKAMLLLSLGPSGHAALPGHGARKGRTLRGR